MYLAASLHAQTRLEGAVSLDFVDPHQLDQCSAPWDSRAVDHFPGAIAAVVVELLFLGGPPPFLVGGVGLGLGFGIAGGRFGEPCEAGDALGRGDGSGAE